jgi:hypothetical protein
VPTPAPISPSKANGADTANSGSTVAAQITESGATPGADPTMLARAGIRRAVT